MHERCRQVCSQRRKYAGHHHVTPFISSVFRNALACSATALHTNTHTIRSLTFLPFGCRQTHTGTPFLPYFSHIPHSTGFHPALPYLPSKRTNLLPSNKPFPHIPIHPFTLSTPPFTRSPHRFTQTTPPFTRSPHRFTQIIFSSLHSTLSLPPVSLQRRVPKSRIVKRVGKIIPCIMKVDNVIFHGNMIERQKELYLLQHDQ